MARNKGTFTFAANFEPLLEAPLDARMRVSVKSDLISPTIWQDVGSNVWLYDGLLVSVVDDPSTSNNGLYFLADKDIYTNYSAWIKIGSTTGILDASGTSSITFQLNNGGYGVVLTDSSGNLSVNTYDGSLASITVGSVSINGKTGAKGEEATIIGDGIVKTFNITHNLNTLRHQIVIYDASTNYQLYPDNQRGLNTDTIYFTEPPEFGWPYHVIMVGF